MNGLTTLQALILATLLLSMVAGAYALDSRTKKKGHPMHPLGSRLARRFFQSSETLDGYEQPELVDVIFRKTQAYQPQGEWLEIAGASSVLDFGGGCGIHYKQAQSPDIRWAVVETPAMVERAKELATDRLRFFTSKPRRGLAILM